MGDASNNRDANGRDASNTLEHQQQKGRYCEQKSQQQTRHQGTACRDAVTSKDVSNGVDASKSTIGKNSRDCNNNRDASNIREAVAQI